MRQAARVRGEVKAKDLAPNVCAVYVEEAYRRRGIAGALLNHACALTGPPPAVLDSAHSAAAMAH